MKVGAGAARSLFVAGTILVAAHVTLLVFDPRALFLSNLFNIMYPLLGVTLCLLGAYSESPETRPLWLLFGCGLLVAAVGELGLTYYDFGTHIHTQGQALNSDFFFFAYAIPVMLAICSRGTDAGLKSMARWGSSAHRNHARILAALLRIALSYPSRGHLRDQSRVFEQCGEFDSGWSCDPTILFQSEPGKKTLLSYPRRLSVGQWDGGAYPGPP
jgi:hypothetical protein